MFRVAQDTAPAVEVRCRKDAAPINLAGATVELVIFKPNGSSVTKSTSVVSATLGRVRANLATSDTDLIGTYTVETKITFADSSVQHARKPFYFEVVAEGAARG